MASFTISGVSPPFNSVSVKACSTPQQCTNATELVTGVTNSTITFAAIEDGYNHTYTVTINKDGCIVSKTFDLVCSGTPTATVSSSCPSTTGNVTITTSTGTYTTNRYIAYLEKLVDNVWQGNQPNGTVFINPTASQGGTHTFTGLANGQYRVHLIDSVDSQSIFISEAQTISCTPSSSLTVWATCVNNTFTFTSTGNGSVVEYQANGITEWTENPGPYTIGYDANSSSYILRARYKNNPFSEVTATYNPFQNCDSVIPNVSVGSCTAGANTGRIIATVPTGVYANNYALQLRKNGSQVGNTLNSGILYLLALPYLVASVFGVIWYRNYKAKKRATTQF